MAASVGKLQLELDLALGKLTSSISIAQKQIERFATKSTKSLSSIAANANLELAKKAIEGVTKAWRFLVEGNETREFNQNVEDLSAAFNLFRQQLGESITRSTAFNEALRVLRDWVYRAANSVSELGTTLGDGLAYALVAVQAPLVVIKGLLAGLNVWLGILAKGWQVMFAGLARVVEFTPFLRALAEGIKELGGPDVVASIDGLAGAFSDISAGAFETAAEEFEAMKKNASELGANIDAVNAKAGGRSTSAAAPSGKKAGGGKPAKPSKAAPMVFGAFSVEQSEASATAIATANAIKANAAMLAASEASLARLAEIVGELQAKLDELRMAYAEIAAFAGGVMLDAVFQPLEDGMLDIEKIVANVKAAVLDLIKQLIMAAALKAAFGVATGGVGGAILTAMGFAGGGLVGGVGGPTADANLAWLSRGEYVMDAGTVDRYGAGFFAALQQRRLPAFASGGLVGGGGAGARAAAGPPISFAIDARGMDEDQLSRSIGRALRAAGIRGDSSLRAVHPTSSTSLLRRG